jgi:2-C-methyl-D-erythritol 2,4-cyclodiphosphate synthase
VGERLIGLGFDVHPSDASRKLFLGGVRFDGESGLAGHSDGDAVCHALADALLGAAGLGDVGQHFPDTDPKVAGMEGMELLSRTVAKVRVAGRSPVSADVTVIADRPSIAPRRDEMRTTLAAALGISIERMSVKASRPEGLGLSGDGAACLALAVLDEG